jgi:ribosomal protein S11
MEKFKQLNIQNNTKKLEKKNKPIPKSSNKYPQWPRFKGPYKKNYKFQKPKKRRLSWREKLVLSKKNPDNRKYMAFYSRSRNNTFITVTNIKGQVIISQSAGSCKITTKKKKKSWDTLKAIAISTAKLARSKNIRYIFNLYTTSTYKKTSKIVFEGFKEVGLQILKCVLIRSRPHGIPMRKKKMKRL